MRIVLLALCLMTYSSVWAADPHIPSVDPYCTNGKISYFKYNVDNSVTVKIGNKEFFTTRERLQPLLFSAYLTGADTYIFSRNCHNGGGFSEAAFF